MELNRQNFLAVYLVLKDKDWDAIYLYQKLIDIFGPVGIKYLDNLFERQVIDTNDLSKTPSDENEHILPTLNIAELEKMAIIEALKRSNWLQNKAAKLVGKSARALNYLISSYNIKHPSWKKNKERK